MAFYSVKKFNSWPALDHLIQLPLQLRIVEWRRLDCAGELVVGSPANGQFFRAKEQYLGRIDRCRKVSRRM
jgi:hypothetical protein